MARPRIERPDIRPTDIRTEEAREPVRTKTRTRKGVNVNQFHVPVELRERLAMDYGTDIQFNTDSVLGRPEPHMRTVMARQGWEPVTSDMFDGMFDGMFTPKGHKGEINVGGLVLEYRPMELTDEARAEELASARHARNVEERKIERGAPDGVDPGFMNTNQATARANTFIRREVGRVPSMPLPD